MNPDHRVYTYLLRGLTIERPNQVCSADITYIPVQGGFLYLVAIMDWASRRVLAWRLSNTMDTSFCLAALAEALQGYGIPEIFNTDQGSQFTSIAFTGQLEATGIRCSMDGRVRCLDKGYASYCTSCSAFDATLGKRRRLASLRPGLLAGASVPGCS